MTDSILRSYQYYSTTSMVPFPVSAPAASPEDASYLLTGETDGFAINAMTYDTLTAADYAGGPVGGSLAVVDSGTPANNLTDVAFDKSNLVNASTSAKVVVNSSSPYVRWSAHNLVLRSEAIVNGVGWTQTGVTSITNNDTTSPSGTTTADKITVNGSDPGGVVADASTLLSGAVYTASIYVKKSVGRWFCISVSDEATVDAKQWFDITNGVIGTTSATAGATVVSGTITNAGSSWYRCQMAYKENATAQKLRAFITNADGATTATASDAMWLWGGQINRGPIATPYLVTTTAIRFGIPQHYDAAAAKYAIWSEPAATNLAIRSEEFENVTAWGQSAASITTNTDTAPDGDTTADLFTADGTSAAHYWRQQINSFASGSISVFVKAGTGSYFALAALDTASSTLHHATQVFDLALGTIGETNLGSSSGTVTTPFITSLGNGWYRCGFNFTHSGTNSYYTLSIATAATGNSFDVFGNPTNSSSGTLKFWGAQAETGPLVSSYIPTQGGTVTRAADVISALDSTFPGSDTNISVYLDYKPLRVDSGTRYGWAYWKDSSNFMSLAGVTADPIMGNTQGGTPDVTTDLGTLVAGTRTQVTIACKANDFDGSQDGAAPTADPSSTLTTGYTTLYLGAFGTTGSELNGYIYRMLFVPYQRETVNGDLETWRYNY